METLEKLANEIGGYGEFRWLSVRDRNKDWRDPSDYNHWMNLNQAKRLASIDEFMEPNGWRNSTAEHDSIVEAAEAVQEEWPMVEVRFDGMLNEYGRLETLYFGFELVEDKEAFKGWMEKKFCSWLHRAEYISEDDPDVQPQTEEFRYPDSDPSLWACTDEIDFWEDEKWGSYCRLWWDD